MGNSRKLNNKQREKLASQLYNMLDKLLDAKVGDEVELCWIDDKHHIWKRVR